MNTMHSSRFSEDGLITVAARREIQSDYWSLSLDSPLTLHGSARLVSRWALCVALPPAEKGNSKHGRPHWVARRFGGSGGGPCLPVRGSLLCASALGHPVGGFGLDALRRDAASAWTRIIPGRLHAVVARA